MGIFFPFLLQQFALTFITSYFPYIMCSGNFFTTAKDHCRVPQIDFLADNKSVHKCPREIKCAPWLPVLVKHSDRLDHSVTCEVLRLLVRFWDIMPTVIRMPKEQVHQRGKNRNGFNIGCFRVCTCVHLEFLTSKSGMLKLFELLLGSCCETLLINFGMRELSATAFHSFLTTVSACLATTFILCLCYTLSSRSFFLIRQSLFVRWLIKAKSVERQLRNNFIHLSQELLFNGLACSLYFMAAFYVGFMSKMPSYRNILLFTLSNTNPALTCIYVSIFKWCLAEVLKPLL